MNEIAEAAHSPEFQDERYAWDHMVVGKPHEVVERLIDIKARAEADELVLVSPGLDRSRRITRNAAIAMDGPRLNRTTSTGLRTGLAVWRTSYSAYAVDQVVRLDWR
jgi:hypothetical protein